MKASGGTKRDLHGWIELALVALGVGWCVARLLGTETSPPGFTPDEAAAGLQAECLVETGRSADGVRWPLFTPGLGGGYFTPAYLYALVGWTKLFGNSIATVRTLGAAFALAATIGLVFLARRIAGATSARLVFVAAALSPWAFTLSRLGADAPVVPAFLVWGVYFLVRRDRVWAGPAGSALLAIAAYSYPPTRVQAPLLLAMLLLVQRPRPSKRTLAVVLGAFALVGLPLFVLIVNGTLTGRAKALSILTEEYVEQHRGVLPAPVFVLKQTLENLWEHLRPSYLFLTGDPNIRHSTQLIGELGWVDTLAVVVAVGAVVRSLARVLSGRHASLDRDDPRAWRIAGLCVLVAAFATLPAALCWEGLPHAYRSIGAYPAVSLFTACVLSVVWRRTRWFPVLVVIGALAQTAVFLPDYFGAYPARSADAFDAALRDAAERHDRATFDRLARSFPPMAFRYFLVRDFGLTCEQSAAEADRMSTGR